jgi:MFS family permease
LLGFTFVLGAAGAIELPAYQALIPELVPRPQLAAAAALGGVNINLARVIGPALAGLVIAKLGVAWCFALNTVSFVFIPLVLLGWRRQITVAAEDPERFLPALRAGGRYVRHDPVTADSPRLAFVAPATALWALLPLIATERLAWRPAGTACCWARWHRQNLGALLLPGWARGSANPHVVDGDGCVCRRLDRRSAVTSRVAAFVALARRGRRDRRHLEQQRGSQLFLRSGSEPGLATYQMVLFGSAEYGSGKRRRDDGSTDDTQRAPWLGRRRSASGR